MFLQRSAITAVRRTVPRALAQRTFATSFVRRDAPKKSEEVPEKIPIAEKVPEGNNPPSLLAGYKTIDQIKGPEDLFAPGAKPGTVPTDLEQSTGLERLEILGKMQGIDIFDMKPLDASRLGTLEDPIVVNSAGNEQYCGCTGFPADSHNVLWITLTREEPVARCMECGSAYKMHYVGPPDDPHAHHDHHGAAPERPRNMADFIKPEYRNA